MCLEVIRPIDLYLGDDECSGDLVSGMNDAFQNDRKGLSHGGKYMFGCMSGAGEDGKRGFLLAAT